MVNSANNEYISILCSEALTKNEDYMKLNEEILDIFNSLKNVLSKEQLHTLDNKFIQMEECIEKISFIQGTIYKD